MPWSRITILILHHTSVIRYRDKGEREKAPSQDNRPKQIRLHQDFHPSRVTNDADDG
jgi:hypothetical protein